MKDNKSFDYSILMSVYYKDNPEWVKIAIDCMLNQTIKTNDFVIIEDGKLTDELEAVIKEYEDKYSFITVKRLEKNMGLGPALAIGMNLCKNEWVARMDSDDIAIPTRIEKQVHIIEEKNVDVIGCINPEFIDTIDNIKTVRVLPETDEEIKKFARRRNPFGHSSILFRKSKVLKAGNYRSFHLCEDYDLWVRLIEDGNAFYNIQEPLVYVRVSEDFIKRRGGVKYLISILKFKKMLLSKKFYSLSDFIISSGSHIIICLLPNKLRDWIYRKFLRKNKEYEWKKN